MKRIYDDGDTRIEVANGAVFFCLEGDDARRWYRPEEAVAIGLALQAAGAEADATEFGDEEGDC